MATTVTREFLAHEAGLAAREVIEYCYEQGWTDGLPVVPPLQEFVYEFLAQTDRDPEEVPMAQEHLDRTCNIRQAAINAVMAGCRPEYFPIVLAVMDAFEGGGSARTNLMQSTTGQAEIIIVNGPIRHTRGHELHWQYLRSRRPPKRDHRAGATTDHHERPRYPAARV
jgi:hypothetical protein